MTARLRAGVLLRPRQVPPVRVHLRRAGEEHRQVPVRQVGVVRQPARDADVPLGQLLADVAGPGVQHQPDPAVVCATLLEADLDEVVAAAERAHLPHAPAPSSCADLAVAGRRSRRQNVVPAAVLQPVYAARVDRRRRVGVKPTGIAASIAERSAPRSSGRSAAVRWSARRTCRSRCRRRRRPGRAPAASRSPSRPWRPCRSARRASPRRRRPTGSAPMLRSCWAACGSMRVGSVQTRTGARVPGSRV